MGLNIECRVASGYEKLEYPDINCRKCIAILTDFGGVDDGKTSSTKVFPHAIGNLSQYAYGSGALLVVSHGKWLIESLNLTSHFIIFLQNEVVILTSQDELEWPLLHVLASYGR
ncbi:putative polygalacturonase-like protein [Trifolium pratense]|uniref:Putative polygalacturonase-like protein n=1 Tax=Trifolium pratense TaxID=57577 RepID=A0A2K3MLG1_TRIPR|nr:putative polygalacturonase-like protein [Trifolium pratense]